MIRHTKNGKYYVGTITEAMLIKARIEQEQGGQAVIDPILKGKTGQHIAGYVVAINGADKEA